ncbi:hypothetical protein D5S17_07925 [Pseudonocardiaceae bacterium YIM PH 21723]|nr:hypothetical protein D5S17_07925 [Pseudonocardiaceae bacterium YIM PH 21723]
MNHVPRQPGWADVGLNGVSIGALLHCDGQAPSIGELRSLVAGRHGATATLSTILDVQGPRWVRRSPDIDRQVREQVLPGDADPGAAAVAAQHEPYLPDMPPWELRLLRREGRPGYAVFYRASHGVQDFGAIARVLELLFAETPPDAAGSAAVVPSLATPVPPTLGERLSAARMQHRSIRRSGIWPPKQYGYGYDQAHHWTTVPSAVVRAVARAYGGSGNDVYVSAVMSAVSDWWAQQLPGESLSPTDVLVAVNIRAPGEAEVPGNLVTMAGISLPPGSWQERMAAMVAATAVLRSPGHREAMRQRALERSEWLADLAAEWGQRPQGEVATSHFVLRAPLLIGADPVVAMDPVTFLPPGNPVATLSLSYRGRTSVQFVTDNALPGMDTLAERWAAGVQDLAAGLPESTGAGQPADR